MKIFKNLIVIGALILSLGLTACSDPVQDDLISYINVELPKISDLEDGVIEGYGSVTGENFIDDYTMYTELSDNVIPLSLELIDKAESISLETKEVREVHEKLIESYTTNQSAMELLIAAIDTENYNLITQANEKFDAARKLQREFKAEIKDLCKDHSVELSE